MNIHDKSKKLLEGKWNNKYLCKLTILDHLRECLEKDNYLKATDTPKGTAGYKNLDKELMDLKIVLDLYFKDSYDLYETRLDKWVSNLDK